MRVRYAGTAGINGPIFYRLLINNINKAKIESVEGKGERLNG